ncbi:response regulator transcription factor [Spirosoma daeguense]
MRDTLLDDCLLQDSSKTPLLSLGSTPSESAHFKVFYTDDQTSPSEGQPIAAYPCRVNYKISLMNGYSRAEYADKVIDITPNSLLFSTPKVPYHWLTKGLNHAGSFCVFTANFLLPAKSGVVLDELPIFKAGGHPVFQLSADEAERVQAIFRKMQEEINSSYAYKYDLLRTYVLELIHLGQKLQPTASIQPVYGAAVRVSSLFTELLERQFPIRTPQQQLRLRTAKEYADQLAVHVNHLNKVLKETTGRTTTELISARIMQEAKLLLKQPNWTLADIAYSLGFTDVAHFSRFFKQQMALAPGAYRTQAFV